MPWYQEIPLFIIEIILLLNVLYNFLMYVTLALFNLIVFIILVFAYQKIYIGIQTIKNKIKLSQRTKDLKKFIQQQNSEVYEQLGVRIECEKEGNWLEFILLDDEKMFEQIIADRKKDMAKRHTEGDRHAKQEMDLMTDLLHNFRVEYD